ncbi:MAG: MRP family ATP-binding protein, partial [Actinobacteria bacterium]|nr:MRP family ATP-binding protein [Actinomycetota bacterium]
MSQEILQAIHSALAGVSDPELHRPLPDLGMVESVSFKDGSAHIKILLTISGCPMRDRLSADINAAVSKVAGVTEIKLDFGVMNEAQRENVKKLLRNGKEKFIPFAQPDSLTRTIGIASGKGGVGKS